MIPRQATPGPRVLVRHANRRYPGFGAREARNQGGYWRLLNERGMYTLMELDDLYREPQAQEVAA